MQWPETHRLVSERLGPLVVAIAEEAYEPLQKVMAELGTAMIRTGDETSPTS